MIAYMIPNMKLLIQNAIETSVTINRRDIILLVIYCTVAIYKKISGMIASSLKRLMRHNDGL